MSSYVLVPATGADTDEPVFATALTVARLLPAHLEFLHVRADVQETLTAMASADAGGGIGFGQLLETLEQEVADRQKRAELAFRDFCEREHLLVSAELSAALPSAEWRVETGDEPTWLAAHGRAADLLVIGRARDGEAVAMDMLEAALMATGRPALIAPAQARSELSGIVAIAWKDGPEAARAVAAAQPFLRMADQAIIFSVIEDIRTDEPSCERLRHALAWHNPKTEVQCLKHGDRSAVDTLLGAVAAANADLLVMGGYGHSRVREVMFGGFTRRVLSHADLPVLMAH
ncbi:MAG TPA: universal stress protein [Acetobacteraceae bacterium]|jgi:nucleotide-binding universal stress UspA family protein